VKLPELGQHGGIVSGGVIPRKGDPSPPSAHNVQTPQQRPNPKKISNNKYKELWEVAKSRGHFANTRTDSTVCPDSSTTTTTTTHPHDPAQTNCLSDLGISCSICYGM
jgi:hypothetical protein